MKKQQKRFFAFLLSMLLIASCVVGDLGSVSVVRAEEPVAVTVSANETEATVSENEAEVTVSGSEAEAVVEAEATVSENDAETTVSENEAEATVSANEAEVAVSGNEAEATVSANEVEVVVSESAEPIALAAAADENTVSYVFTEDLIVGQTYMDGRISVGTDMTYTAYESATALQDVSGNDVGSVNGYVTNKTNSNPTDGTGALLRFTPEKAGTITVALQLGGGKTFKITKADGTTIFEHANGDTKLNLKFAPVEVEAGVTYYIFGAGTKARFYSIDYVIEQMTTTIVEEKTNSFVFTEDLVVGQTYMDGMISVGTDMTFTASTVALQDVSGNEAGSVAGYVTNKTNSNPTDGTGALLRFAPTNDGTIAVAVQLGGGKTFKITKADGTEVFAYANGDQKLNLKFAPVAVEAGTTYYIFGAGTKARFYSVDYVYEEVKEVVLEEKTDSFVFTEDLVVGKTYMNEMVSVGTDMTFTASTVALQDVSGNDAGSVAGYVTNKTNASPTDGTGALLRFTPAKDGSIAVAVQLGGGKTFKITKADGTEVFAYANGDQKLNLKFAPVEVEAGVTYYIFGAGTKARFYSIDYTYLAPKEEKEELPPIELVDGVKAFDTAVGGGMYATGGRGGDVYVVTSLADDGKEGTLRYGINTAPAEGRIIVFNVGGTIHLRDTLKLNDNITLAGQTAPGEGITIAGYDTDISDCDNIIIRFIHFRPGTAGLLDGGDSIDALWGRDNDTFIIDHCSFSWNTDECLSTYRGQNGTVQYCIISESLTVSGHSKGRHGYGGIFGGENTVFQYNLIADHTSRNPRVGGGYMGMDDPEHVATLQISNNVTYNYGYFACYGGGNAETNYINNYLKVGPGTRETLYGALIDYGESGEHDGGLYLSGNVVENIDGSQTKSDTKGVTYNSSSNYTDYKADKAYEMTAFESINPVSAEAAYDIVLAQAGVTYPKRDAIDARVVQGVENGTGYYINSQDNVGGYCAPEVTREASYDTDMDGIPDAWETANGLNPADGTDSRLLNDAGYAWVEVYFNDLVKEVTAADYVAKNPEVKIDLANNTLLDEGGSVTVTATATATNGGSIAKVVFMNGAEIVAEDAEAPFTYTYAGLTDGSYDISVRAYDNDGNGTQSETSKLHVNSTAGTGEDWTVTDIGTPGVKSTASYIDGVMTVKGAGKLGKSESATSKAYDDATTDDFAYVYQKIEGDVEIVTKLDSYIVVDSHTFNGLMFRESLDDNAAAVALGLSMVKIEQNTTWSAIMVNRAKTKGNMSVISETIDSASAAEKANIPMVQDLNFKNVSTGEYKGTWLKLIRKGDTFTGFASDDGLNWKMVGTLTVDLPETAYVGFAVDANKVANNLENYATAKFSNIELNTEFAYLTYDVENVKYEGADITTIGKDMTVQFTKVYGYLLPEAVEVINTKGDIVTSAYDAETGVLTLTNIQEDLTIRAAGVKRVVEAVDYEVLDPNGLLTVTKLEDGSIELKQVATSGAVAQNANVAPVNESFVLFPETKDAQTISMKIKITDRTVIDKGDQNGVFIGNFSTENYAFTALGMRAKETNSLTGFWTKAGANGGYVGEGSSEIKGTKYALQEDMEYDVTFYTNSDGWFRVTFKSADGTVDDAKLFKAHENYIQAGDKVRYGIGLIGATCVISDLTVIDYEGNQIYPAVVSDERNETVEELKDSVAAVETLNASEYTAESWAALQSAIANAQAVLNNGSASAEEVAAAQKAIDDAVAALAKPGTGGSDSSDDSDDSDDSAQSSTATAPKTGDKTPIGAIIALLVLAMAAVAGVLVYKKKEQKN